MSDTNQNMASMFLSVGVYSLAPLSFFDDEGEWTGYEIAILKQFATYLQHSLRIVELPFDGIWFAPADGEVDIAAGISILPERKKNSVAFSHSIHRLHQSLLIRKENCNAIHSLDHLKEKTIGVVTGTTGEQHARAHAPPTAKFRAFANEHTMLEALRSGGIAAIARGTIGNNYRAQKEPLFFVTGICKSDFEDVAFVTRDSNLTVLLDTFLDKLYQSGELDALHRQWFSSPLNDELAQSYAKRLNLFFG